MLISASVSPASTHHDTTTPAPDLSVVVPSVNGVSTLLACLAAVDDNCTSGLAIELLVVDRCGESVRRAVRDRFPEVVVLPVAPSTSIPEMRAAAFRRAKAEAVAVIEDHILVPRDWARRMLAVLAEGHDVVSGSIDNAAEQRTVDRAAFLCEYSHVATGAPQQTAAIAGNNVVYRRALLETYARTIAVGRWEDHLHQEMRRDGVRFMPRPDIEVRHEMHYRVRDYLSQRFLYARAYAGVKGRDMSLLRRTAFSLGTVALPAVLLGRIVRNTLVRPRHRRHLLSALPLLTLFVAVWTAGETVGYAVGPGDAMSRIR